MKLTDEVRRTHVMVYIWTLDKKPSMYTSELCVRISMQQEGEVRRVYGVTCAAMYTNLIMFDELVNAC